MKTKFLQILKYTIYKVLFICLCTLHTYASDISLSFSCETGCIDLEINGGIGPYEVEWQRWDRTQYVTIPGWPKTNLQGNDGNEDLCGNAISGRGTYRVIVIDALCGYVEATIDVDPCCINRFELESIQMVSDCYTDDSTDPFGGGGFGFQSCNGEIVLDVDVAVVRVTEYNPVHSPEIILVLLAPLDH
jgi:hypothetical protein